MEPRIRTKSGRWQSSKAQSIEQILLILKTTYGPLSTIEIVKKAKSSTYYTHSILLNLKSQGILFCYKYKNSIYWRLDDESRQNLCSMCNKKLYGRMCKFCQANKGKVIKQKKEKKK